MKEEIFVRELLKIGISVNDTQLSLFREYCSFLLAYNEHTNLTAIKNEEEVYLKHFYDCALLLKYVPNLEEKNIIDIGSGAGFPGIVLKILVPSLHVTLLDANNKKISFLKELVEKLSLEHVDFVQERCEEYAIGHLDSYDYVFARAVANLRVLSELCLPLVKENGFFVAMKGNVLLELKESEDTIRILNGKVVDVVNLSLPFEKSERSFVFVSKEAETPLGFPRKYDKILKKPLKINAK